MTVTFVCVLKLEEENSSDLIAVFLNSNSTRGLSRGITIECVVIYTIKVSARLLQMGGYVTIKWLFSVYTVSQLDIETCLLPALKLSGGKCSNNVALPPGLPIK